MYRLCHSTSACDITNICHDTAKPLLMSDASPTFLSALWRR